MSAVPDAFQQPADGARTIDDPLEARAEGSVETRRQTASEAIRSRAYDEEATRAHALETCNRKFAALRPEARVEWALEHLPSAHVLSSSFGAQAAVSLHLVTTVAPRIPIILIDTGYLFPETYRFLDELTERLHLNLKVYRAERSPAWQEARHGQRWLQGRAGLDSYHQENKVEPMRRALKEQNAATWFAGLRRQQSQSRSEIPFLAWSSGRWKVHPIADWSDRDVHRYLNKHALPYHPLWEKGYLSIGDHHSTRPIHEVGTTEQTRFFGLQRECGIHQIDLADL